jgi:hypothetical protein
MEQVVALGHQLGVDTLDERVDLVFSEQLGHRVHVLH